MAAEEGVPPAHAVADAFVEQYFLLLGKKPEEAHRVYVDASVVSRPGLDGSTMMSFTSVESINKHFLSCDYKNTTFELLSVDSQNSLEDGIFIMIIGFLTGKDNLKRKFSQMFYLARQNNVYIVLNDIFRFVDEAASTPVTVTVVESVPATEVAKPAEEVNKTEPIHKVDASAEKSVNAAEVKNAVAGVSPPLDNGKIKHSEEKTVTAQKPTEPVAETVVAPQADGAKRSFADIVQRMASIPAPIQNKVPVQKTRHVGHSRPAPAPQDRPASVSNSEKKREQKIVEEPGTSIFVANLPMNAMPPQLHELFKSFGPIKENGVQVRSSRGNGICFGFVAFESAASVQSVLQASKNTPFMLADRKLRVKEKEVDYDGSKASSGRSRGGSRTQNGSAEGGDEFKRPRNRRNSGKTERKGDRNATNGDNNQKSNEGAAAEVQA